MKNDFDEALYQQMQREFDDSLAASQAREPRNFARKAGIARRLPTGQNTEHPAPVKNFGGKIKKGARLPSDRRRR
ncbi:MAG: hypothetical protein A2751_03330 [Candidatus Doudnabacteria bacterium RIFCSPHIGHO2_01_FULL_46_14]|uniref:Uncharacterized protein n=1 Tax=Candidatus Doudnabacteria bacterium RIFCSPHIGHO2_01_FULL_46_14 TaxID=1817824 RepID=A0A1F5NKD7_9BACT|nr:MAG: hypothetical protein A2751_03330 [Candidatus Doudnabacteria bacterium RIFCSPHIGHO2_01_FULL_46_14]